jgi:hypothetical protein
VNNADPSPDTSRHLVDCDTSKNVSEARVGNQQPEHAIEKTNPISTTSPDGESVPDFDYLPDGSLSVGYAPRAANEKTKPKP